MSYLEVLDTNSVELPTEDSILIGCSPDMIATGGPDEPYSDWLSGYMLIRSLTPSQHDGHPATLITLSDSQGEREVGRLILRNDALRDAQLEVMRIFESEAHKVDWLNVNAKPGTDEVKFVELDTAYDTDGSGETLTDALMLVTAGTDISYRIVNPHGPGGGWPVVRYTGKDRELRHMMKEHFSMDAAEIEEFLASA